MVSVKCRRIIAPAAPLLAVILALTACGPYSFRPGGKQSFDSVAVPLFENRTAEYGIREQLTEGVINRFIQDGTLKVVNEKRAGAVLRGVIVNYQRDPYTYDVSEQVKEYRVTITIQARLEDPVKRNVIWQEDALSQWGIYEASSESENDGKQRAVEKLAEDIVNRTVKGW